MFAQLAKQSKEKKEVCVPVQWCKYHPIPSEPTIFGVCCGVMHGAWRKLSAWSIHNNKTKGIEILLSFARPQSEENIITQTKKKKEKNNPPPDHVPSFWKADYEPWSWDERLLVLVEFSS